MASVSRRSTLALAICCGVLLASQALFVTIPASGASGSSTCSELRRWAQSYRGTSPTLEQLARYDRPHRIAIFNTVSPQVRAALWQEQLRRFDQRSDLSLAQHQLIAEARELVTPDAYAHSPVVSTAMKELKPRLGEAFTVREQRQALSVLAFTTVVPGTQATTLWDKLVNPFVANAQLPNCDCNTSNGSFDCLSALCPSATCTWISGCGPFGLYICDGQCV
jgi:hypothetical protein